MLFSQSPPLAEKDWPIAEETSGRPVRRQDARSEPRFGGRPVNGSVHSLHPASNRRSIGRRIFRSLSRFCIAVLIGIGATLAWQSDSAKQMVVVRAPTLAWLLSVSSPVVAAPPQEQGQQIELLATNLYGVRRSLEQLVAKQEQTLQNIMALQAVEEDIKQLIASTPPTPSQPPPVPQQKLPQPKAHSSAVQSSSAPRPQLPAEPQLPR
jgi:hypothetical protein